MEEDLNDRFSFVGAASVGQPELENRVSEEERRAQGTEAAKKSMTE